MESNVVSEFEMLVKKESLQTILICIVGEIEGGGYIDVAHGIT